MRYPRPIPRVDEQRALRSGRWRESWDLGAAGRMSTIPTVHDMEAGILMSPIPTVHGMEAGILAPPGTTPRLPYMTPFLRIHGCVRVGGFVECGMGREGREGDVMLGLQSMQMSPLYLSLHASLSLCTHVL